VLAYEQLLAEGYLETRIGAAGTVVAPVLPPDAGYPGSSKSLHAQRRTRSRTGPRLANPGGRIVKSARAIAKSLGMRPLSWERTPPRSAYDFRPGRAAFADLPYARGCRLRGS